MEAQRLFAGCPRRPAPWSAETTAHHLKDRQIIVRCIPSKAARPARRCGMRNQKRSRHLSDQAQRGFESPTSSGLDVSLVYESRSRMMQFLQEADFGVCRGLLQHRTMAQWGRQAPVLPRNSSELRWATIKSRASPHRPFDLSCTVLFSG